MQKITRTGFTFGARKSSSSFNSRGPKRNYSSGSGRGRYQSNRGGSAIDERRFVKKAKPVAQITPAEIKNKFTDFNFSDQLKNNLTERGYETPTEIQDQSIEHMLEGRDLVGLANTGTGKTAAFLLPMIEKVTKDREQKALIIVPTRELAIQVEHELFRFTRGLGVLGVICVGGLPVHKQIQQLRRRPNFVIGTPGRLKDLEKRHAISFGHFNNVVLDEVDRMLDMGFVDEITEMLGKLPKNRQSLFFSATMPPKIKNLVSTFQNNPITVDVVVGETTDNVDQDIVRVYDRTEKYRKLETILKGEEFSRVLIFSETKRDVERLATDLVKSGFKAESIHGDKRQSQRQRALDMFKKSHVDILVATDVAARGIDIKGVTHVINYTAPKNYDDYVHRIGRTGRAGKTGVALTFVGA